MEYAECGDLSTLIKKGKPVDESILVKWLFQLCEALKYIHKLKILHRDIKPQNIMLTSKDVVSL